MNSTATQTENRRSSEKSDARAKRPALVYTDSTKKLAAWLFDYLPRGHSDRGLIERHDHGFLSRKTDRPEYVVTNHALESYWRGESDYIDRLSKTGLQSHLAGHDKLYAASAGEMAHVVIDVDAHYGESDAFEATQFIVARFFPGAYFEASNRGYHVHLAVRIDVGRREFNGLMSDVQSALGMILSEHGFDAKAELKGGLTIRDGNRVESRGSLAPLPVLWNSDDVNRLLSSPGYTLDAFRAVVDEATMIRELTGEVSDRLSMNATDKRSNLAGCDDWRMNPDAFTRMNGACFEFTKRFYRMPSVGDLVDFYDAECPLATVDADTYKRAESVIKRREKVYDISKASEAGYSACRDRLLADIRRFCIDRTSKYRAGITDEDLAVTLYTITRNSFVVHERAIRQFSCPNSAITGMFDCLRSAGVIDRCASNRNKLVAMRHILENAGLIDCLDEKWVHTGRKSSGVGKKWVIGHNHYRNAEFTRWSQGITYRRVGQQAETSVTQHSEVYVSWDVSRDVSGISDAEKSGHISLVNGSNGLVTGTQPIPIANWRIVHDRDGPAIAA